MSQNESFEDKIRQQLESYEVPYQKAYWKSYTRRFPTNRIAFWQRWYVPYLFSLLLFGGLFGWLQFDRNANRPTAYPQRIDTLLVEKTIYVRDTLVVRDTVYYLPKWSETALNRAAAILSKKHKESEATAEQGNDNSTNQQESTLTTASGGPTGSPNNPASALGNAENSMDDREAAPQPAQTSLNTASTPEKAVEARFQADTTAKQTADQALAPAISPSDSAENGASDTLNAAAESALPATAEEEVEINTPERSLFVSAGPRLTLFSPWGTGNFDIYGGLFAGGQINLEWQRLQLSTGLQYGAMLHEIDDISLLTPGQRNTFPGHAQINPAPEGISILSQQFMIPLQLHYTAFERGQWRGSVGMGVLANYLVREDFIYDIDNQDDALWNRALGQRQRLEIAHLQVGGGISYQLHQQLELQAQLYYNHGLRKLGLGQTNSQGPSLQLGANWLLTR